MAKKTKASETEEKVKEDEPKKKRSAKEIRSKLYGDKE